VLAERYEYTPYGKRTVYSRGWLLGDLDDDGAAATSADQTVMTGQFGTSDPAARSDMDGDGDVDLDDFTAMAAQSGQSIAAADPLVHHPRHGSFRGRLSAGNPAVLCEFGHQGLQHDEENDLVYNRARMLIPFYGRFGGRDPLEYHSSQNLHEYELSTPNSFVDPDGKNPVALALLVAYAACAGPPSAYAHGVPEWGMRDKMKHCYVSCMMARNCSAAASAIIGVTREAFQAALLPTHDPATIQQLWDGLADQQANNEGIDCAGWETWVGCGNIGRWFRMSCNDCCEAKAATHGHANGW